MIEPTPPPPFRINAALDPMATAAAAAALQVHAWLLLARPSNSAVICGPAGSWQHRCKKHGENGMQLYLHSLCLIRHRRLLSLMPTISRPAVWRPIGNSRPICSPESNAHVDITL